MDSFFKFIFIFQRARFIQNIGQSTSENWINSFETAEKMYPVLRP